MICFEFSQFFFDLLVTGQIRKLILQRRLDGIIDQFGLGLHLFDPALQLVEAAHGIAAVVAADLLLCFLLSAGLPVPLHQNALFLLRAVELVLERGNILLVLLDQGILLLQFLAQDLLLFGTAAFFKQCFPGQVIPALADGQLGPR